MREVIKLSAAYRHHGSFTPTVVFTEPPPLRDPAFRQDYGWTEVSLSPLLVMAVPGAARYLPPDVFAHTAMVVMAHPLTWLIAHHEQQRQRI